MVAECGEPGALSSMRIDHCVVPIFVGANKTIT
jgi:hypothetical protein